MIAPNHLNLVPGPAIDSRAPKPTQLVMGMNGPARGLKLVPGLDQPVSLRPTCKSTNQQQLIEGFSLETQFFLSQTEVSAQTTVFPHYHLHSTINRGFFTGKPVFPLSN